MFLRPILRMGVLVCGALAGPCLLAQTAPATAPRAPSALVVQDVQDRPDAVIDPAVPVPAVVYRSVFGGASAGVESGTVDWRSANETVGQFRRGHVDILKWESEHEGKH